MVSNFYLDRPDSSCLDSKSPKIREFRNYVSSLTVEPDVVKMDYLSDICLSAVTIITVDIVLINENIFIPKMPKCQKMI